MPKIKKIVKFSRFMNEKFIKSIQKDAEVEFETVDINTPFVQDFIKREAKIRGLTEEEMTDMLLDMLDDLTEKFEGATERASRVFNKNALENILFEVMTPSDDVPKITIKHLKEMVKWINVANPAFFKLKDPITGKRVKISIHITPAPSFIKQPDWMKAVDTAAATVNGELIFNVNFCHKLAQYAKIKNVKPEGGMYESNGGPIPDEFAYIEFLILHEIYHIVHADHFYQSKLGDYLLENADRYPRLLGAAGYRQGDPNSLIRAVKSVIGRIQNYVGDYITNYELVKKGYAQLPIGLFADEYNYDHFDSMRDIQIAVINDMEESYENSPENDMMENLQDKLDQMDDHLDANNEQNKDGAQPPAPGESEFGAEDGNSGDGDGEEGEDSGDGGDSGDSGDGTDGEDGTGGTDGADGADRASSEDDEPGEGSGSKGNKTGGAAPQKVAQEDIEAAKKQEAQSRSKENKENLSDEDSDSNETGDNKESSDKIDDAMRQSNEDLEGMDKEERNALDEETVKEKLREMQEEADKEEEQRLADLEEERRLRKEQREKEQGNNKDDKKVRLNPIDWKTLLKKMVPKPIEVEEESITKMHNRTKSALATAFDSKSNDGIAVKAGIIKDEKNEQKLLFILDNSGSMSRTIAEVNKDILGVMNRARKLNINDIYIIKFDSTWDVYKINLAKKGNKHTFQQFEKIKDIEKDINKAKLKTTKIPIEQLFIETWGAGTTFPVAMSKIVLKLIDGNQELWNAVMFTDTDILEPLNLKVLQSICMKAKKRPFSFNLILNNKSNYELVKKAIGGYKYASYIK